MATWIPLSETSRDMLENIMELSSSAWRVEDKMLKTDVVFKKRTGKTEDIFKPLRGGKQLFLGKVEKKE